jgi:hypothetical protein
MSDADERSNPGESDTEAPSLPARRPFMRPVFDIPQKSARSCWPNGARR